MELQDCLRKRRDTRHFLTDPVPEEILAQAFASAHLAPSVGMSEPWRFVRVQSELKRELLYQNYSQAAASTNTLDLSPERKALLSSLKLEALREAPVVIALFCERPPPDQFTIGVQSAQNAFVWSCVCAIQNFWLALTELGYSAGWVTILDLIEIKKLLAVPNDWEALGVLCVGKPATNYDGVPMLEKLGWKGRSAEPVVMTV